MTFSGIMCFKIILKVTKNEGSTLSIEGTFFKKPRKGKFDPYIGRLSKTLFGVKTFNPFLSFTSTYIVF